MNDPVSLSTPPRMINADGVSRHVGVEIEFAALSAAEAAELIKRLFGGAVLALNPHRFSVTGTRFGDFEVELDFQYAHPDIAEQPDEAGAQTILTQFREILHVTLGEVSALVVPCEVVCPPIPLDQLPDLEALPKALRVAGAHSTDTSIFYAFGLHLNPEIADPSTRYITSVLKAYLLLSEWLREKVDVDLTRRILSFVEPFPDAYVELVADAGYWPDTEQLIDDYMAYNPTRNRELDMLPLFAWLDEDRVRHSVGDTRIQERPTFHYRLPNSSLTEPDWTLVREWNRWCAVERLADDPAQLDHMQEAYAKARATGAQTEWANEVGRWIK